MAIKNSLFTSGQIITLASGETYTLGRDEVLINTDIYKKADLQIALNNNESTADENAVMVAIKNKKNESTIPNGYSIFNEWEINGVEQTSLSEVVNNIISALSYVEYMSLTNNDLGIDAWGRAKTVNDYTLFSGMWTFHVPNRQWLHYNAPKTPGFPYTEVSGGIPKDNSNKYVKSEHGHLLVVSDGTNDTSIWSKRHPRYQPNKGYLISTAVICPNPTQIGNREWGLNNGQSGVFFRLEGDGSNWKIYAGKITTVSGVKDFQYIDITSKILERFPNFDPSKGHVYDIQMQWRGVGDFFFFINLVKIHTNEMLGTLTDMSVNNPALNVAFSSYGAVADLSLKIGCVDVTSEGGHKSNKVYNAINSGQVLLNTIKNSENGTAVIAIRLPSSVSYNGNNVAYTRDLNFIRMTTFNKDEFTTTVWSGRLIDATTLDAISTHATDPSLGWVEADDSFFEYMTGGVGSALETAFQTDRAAGKIMSGLSVRQEKDVALSVINPSTDEMEVIISAGDIYVFNHRPDSVSNIGGGITLEFAEEV